MPEFRYRPNIKKAVKPYWNYRLLTFNKEVAKS